MDEFKNNANEISKIKKEPPFKVPDKYFNDFSARLHSRIESETNTDPQRETSIIRYLKPALGLAASFALIFLLAYWPLRSFLPQYMADNNTVIEQVDEMETYMSSIERIDENTFFSLMVETLAEPEETEEDFTDEELLNYLSANLSDYELYLHTEN